MTADSQIWQEEQERVNYVNRVIQNKISQFETQLGGLTYDIVEFRRDFWDEVSINFGDAYETTETVVSIRQQAEILSDKERRHQHAIRQLKTYQRLLDSPYFGRIDFREQGDTTPLTIYIGVGSLKDESDEDFLVYDWRAPVASLYYDYPPGPAKYDTPAGNIEGTIEVKRQYSILGGKIKSMFDAGITIGDELLQEVLGQHSSAQMKTIVATIQQEQNRIIRNERSHVLIVQGPAGSGKTSAALQRAAYLLYRHRNTLTANQIVLFSPNPMFNSYVSTVLPELGENNMQQATLQEYFERRLGTQFTLEDPFDHMEYTLTAVGASDYEARMEGVQFKSSMDFMEWLMHYIDELGTRGLVFRGLRLRGEILISGRVISEYFYNLDPTLSIPLRLSLVMRWLLSLLKEHAKEERNKPWVAEEVQNLDNDAFVSAHHKLRKRGRYTDESFDDFAQEERILADRVIQKYFRRLSMLVKNLRFVDTQAVFRRFFEQRGNLVEFRPETRPLNWEQICDDTVSRLSNGQLAYEDAAPYLFLKEQIEGIHTNTRVKHVFIDEAQDYSPFQFALIRKLFPWSRMTMLGDTNQAIFTHAQGREYTGLRTLAGTEHTETIVLTRSYRSTRPIIQFTSSLLQDGAEIEPFNRVGRKPSLTIVSSREILYSQLRGEITALQSRGHRSIAVICKSQAEANDAHKELRKHMAVSLITKDTSLFKPEVVVIPSYLAKGVEFDAVLLYDASQSVYDKESLRKLFYTACTRAMHELHLYSLGEPTRFLKDTPSELILRTETTGN